MKKLILALGILLSFTIVSYAIDFDTIVKLNERVVELKLELQKQLLMKKYNNQVIGSYEMKDGKINLEAYSIPINGEAVFKVGEVRSLDSFEVLSKYNSLPDKNFGESSANNTLVKGLTLTGMLMLMAALSLVIYNKKRRKVKTAAKVEEVIEEKERKAA